MQMTSPRFQEFARMDAIDRKILAVVQDDASMSVAEIGSRVGLSSTPCCRITMRNIRSRA